MERMHELASVFAIKICAYALMSNHYHLVLYVDQEQSLGWSDAEVLKRYKQIFQSGKALDKAEQHTANGKEMNAERPIDALRERLTDISWFMRCFMF